jgi:hypothetical protein
MDAKKPRRPLYKRWWFWVSAIILLIIIIAAAAGGCRNQENGPDGSEPAPPAAGQSAAMTEPSPSPSPTVSTASADIQLTSGNYTAGTDFPPGTYDIVAVAGSGNVSSSNVYSGGINAVMGTEEENEAIGSDMYQQEYSNINLSEGVVLSVSGGVTIRITSDKADPAPLRPRQQSITETVTLGNGNFTAGKDFPAGTYDIVTVSGSGNVSSDNVFSGGINAVMGTKEANAAIGSNLYEQSYKNIELPDKTTLSIDAVKIQLIPSK